MRAASNWCWRRLEFVDEEVADAVGGGDGGIGGKAVGACEDALCDLRDFNEVDGAGFGEDYLQLGGGVAEEGETGADDLPVFFGVAGWGQGGDGGEGGFEAGDGGEGSDEIEEPGLFGLAVGRETEAFVYRFAECGATGENQIGETEIGLASVFEQVVPKERNAGKLGQLGQFAMELIAGLGAGETGEFKGFLARAGGLIEKPA